VALDNVLNFIAAMCQTYHHKGSVKNYRLIKLISSVHSRVPKIFEVNLLME